MIEMLSIPPLSLVCYLVILTIQRLVRGVRGKDLLSKNDDWIVVNLPVAISLGVFLARQIADRG